MNSISIHLNKRPTRWLNTNRAKLSQNGLQKYTIPIENNHSCKKKVFLIKSLRQTEVESGKRERVRDGERESKKIEEHNNFIL